MPSSISSSDQRLPAVDMRIWVVGLVLALLGLATLELAWRSHGFEPSLTDDLELWSSERARLNDGGERTLVLVGGSRIQLGFEPETFEARYPSYDVVNLSVNGLRPMAVLEDLAADEGFRGVALVSLLSLDLGPKYWDGQAPYVEHHASQWGWPSRITRSLRTFLQRHFVFSLPELQLQRVVPRLAKAKGLLPQWLLTRPNRFREAHYDRRPDLEEVLETRVETTRKDMRDEPMDDSHWRAGLRRLTELVDRIQRRGGRVVLIRYPTTGEVWDLEEAAYPRARYWDEISEQTSATTIHFLDLIEADRFDCPDGSHLEYPDAVRFTEIVGEALHERGLIGD